MIRSGYLFIVKELLPLQAAVADDRFVQDDKLLVLIVRALESHSKAFTHGGFGPRYSLHDRNIAQTINSLVSFNFNVEPAGRPTISTRH